MCILPIPITNQEIRKLNKPRKNQRALPRVKWPTGAELIAGVDDVGRGPLAGPVVAAAVILNPAKRIRGLADSKALPEQKREMLFPIIQKNALAWAIGRAEVAEIDELNIFHAGLLAMQRAILALTLTPQHIQVDGTHYPEVPYTAEAIVKGDQKIAQISAASILAKVIRDREMVEMDKLYPGYGFAEHKGYTTKGHLEALQRLGPCAIHRRSFAPIKDFQDKS